MDSFALIEDVHFSIMPQGSFSYDDSAACKFHIKTIWSSFRCSYNPVHYSDSVQCYISTSHSATDTPQQWREVVEVGKI